MDHELNVTRDAGLRPADGYWDSDSDHLEPFEDDAGAHLFGDLDSSFRGDDDDDDSLDILDDEESLAGARAIAEKFARATKSLISKSRRRGSSQALSKITVDDFEEGFEQQAFLIVEEQASRLFMEKPDPKRQLDALAYFFGVQDAGDATFQVCCDVLQTRADVIRMRIQYEWWLRFTVFSGPWTFMAVPIPAGLVEEIGYYVPRGGLDLAREIWVQPGIADADVIDRVIHQGRGWTLDVLERALEQLEQRMILSRMAHACYLTGRNPLLRSVDASGMHEAADIAKRSATVHWSGLFPGW